jgi:hypothetical protein
MVVIPNSAEVFRTVFRFVPPMTVDHLDATVLRRISSPGPSLRPDHSTFGVLPLSRHMMQTILSDVGPHARLSRPTALVRAPKMRPGDEPRVNLGGSVGGFLEYDL